MQPGGDDDMKRRKEMAEVADKTYARDLNRERASGAIRDERPLQRNLRPTRRTR